MNKAKVLGNIIHILLIMPIWYYLLYQILARVNATELMWFLFWIYVPASLLGLILVEIGTSRLNV